MKNITATKKIIEPKTVQDRKIFIVRNVESIISSIILRETPNYVLYGGVLYKPPIWVVIQSVGCIITYVQIIQPTKGRDNDGTNSQPSTQKAT